MMTISEIAVTITIWVLTAAGGFFGLRAVFRKRGERLNPPASSTGQKGLGRTGC